MEFKQWLAQNEGLVDRATTHFSQVGMPRGKQKHSKRVMQSVKQAGGDRAARTAALFHDYIERGGDLELAKKLFRLSDRVTNIIRYLSDPEKMDSEESPINTPLAHIQAVLKDSKIAPDEKRIIVLIKIADRMDNLFRRIKAKSLGKYYVAKSRELLNLLFNFYYTNFGKDSSIKKMFNKLKELDTQIKKPIGLEKPWKQSLPMLPKIAITA